MQELPVFELKTAVILMPSGYLFLCPECDAAEFLPLVQHHLVMCADCQEELDALLRILRASPNGNEGSL